MSSLKLKHSGGNSMSIEAPATNPASNLALKLPATVGSANQFLKNSGTAGTLGWSSLVEDSSGRLLLGTTTAGAAQCDTFTVETTGHTGMTFFSGTSSRGTIAFGDGRSGNAQYRGVIMYDHSDDSMRVVTADAERMRIDSSGNVGINTTSPGAKLQVNDTNPVIAEFYRSDGGTNDEARISLGAYSSNPPSQRGVNLIAKNNGAGHDFTINTSSSHSAGPSEKLKVESGGRLVVPQIYSTAGSSMRDVQIESDGTLCGLSSITAAKTNIADITDISWLYNLKPKTFNFRKKTHNRETNVNTYLDEAEDEKAYGFLAEDVEKINKEFCSYDKDEKGKDVLSGVYYKMMVVPLIKSVQDLKAENAALEARVAALEAG